jgi:hypothetical protein
MPERTHVHLRAFGLAAAFGRRVGENTIAETPQRMASTDNLTTKQKIQ